MNWTTARNRGSSRSASRVVWFLALLSSFGLLVGTASRAAEIVQVRVGNHPTFTRVVFETDWSVGYQIARSLTDEGEPLISVTLEAKSQTRNISSTSVGVELISVEEELGRAVAKIQLRQPNLQIREMILSNPPRIVLDFDHGPLQVAVAPLLESPTALHASTETPSETPPGVAIPSESEVGESELAAVEPAVVESAVVELEIEIAAAPETAESETAAPETVEHESMIAEIAEPTATPQLDASDLPVQVAVPTDTRGLIADTEAGVEQRQDADFRAIDSRVEKPSEPDNRPRRVAKTRAVTTESSLDYRIIAGVVGGIVFVVLAAAVLTRRRSLPKDLDLEELSEEPIADEPSGAIDSELTDRIQNEGFSMTEESATEAARKVAEDSTAAYSLTEVSGNEINRETGFFDEDSEGEKAMDLNAVDLPAEHGEFSAPQPVVTESGDNDVAAMVRGLADRIATLEGRLSESDGARERLERQVAAQTEELRVQRAAIARTQRALRSLSRSDEDQATEPALREPSNDAGSPA